MNSNGANEWIAAKTTMTFMVFDIADRREDISRSGFEVKAPVRTASLRHPLAIDYDTDFLQQMISLGFNGNVNGRSAR